RRTTDEDSRTRSEGKSMSVQHVAVDPACFAAPSRWLGACESMNDAEPISTSSKPVELLAIDDVLERPRRIEQHCRCRTAGRPPVTQHRHERRNPGATRNQE